MSKIRIKYPTSISHIPIPMFDRRKVGSIADMASKLNRASTFKVFSKTTGEVFNDLRELKRWGVTLPEVVVYFKVQNGRVVRRKPKRGSCHEDDGILHGRTGEAREPREGHTRPENGVWKD